MNGVQSEGGEARGRGSFRDVTQPQRQQAYSAAASETLAASKRSAVRMRARAEWCERHGLGDLMPFAAGALDALEMQHGRGRVKPPQVRERVKARFAERDEKECARPGLPADRAQGQGTDDA